MNLTMMKRLFYLGSVIAMILAAQGCDRNNFETGDRMVTRTLNINSQTKTSLQGRDIVWEEGDAVCCIAVYDDKKLDQGRYQVYADIVPENMNGSSAVIKVTSGAAYSPEYIVYPSGDVTYSGGLIDIPVADTYTLCRDNYPVASNISVGCVEQDNVFMRNVMALIKFEVKYPEDADMELDAITQIIVSSNAGEALAGRMTYNPAENKVTAVDGSTSITLSVPEDETYIPEGVYYFPVPSITLAQGLKVKVQRIDSWVASKSYVDVLDLERNSIINIGKTTEWGLKFEDTVRTIKAVFSDGAKVNNGWAFVEDEPKINDVCGNGIVGPFHLPDNDDAPFYFYVANKINSDSWRCTGGAGRRFGGTEHDYMLLPALEGCRLVSVTILSGKAVKYAITDNPESGVPTPVAGGEAVSIGEKKSHTFVLGASEVNTAYRLDLPTATQSAIYEFELFYEKE